MIQTIMRIHHATSANILRFLGGEVKTPRSRSCTAAKKLRKRDKKTNYIKTECALNAQKCEFQLKFSTALHTHIKMTAN